MELYCKTSAYQPYPPGTSIIPGRRTGQTKSP
nr:MAG TPA: hypothetical protein [Caudoviricetes sp.]